MKTESSVPTDDEAMRASGVEENVIAVFGKDEADRAQARVSRLNQRRSADHRLTAERGFVPRDFGADQSVPNSD
jgi:hypothetical protein